MAGRRAGTKRSDKRWISDDGTVWASKLECEVFDTLSADPRLVVRKCEQGGSDTFPYEEPVRSAMCKSCGSDQAVQRRTYTPDIYVHPSTKGGDRRGYYLEVKGYFPGPSRNLFRYYLKARGSTDVRLVLSAGNAHRPATSRLTLFEYCVKYMKIPVHVWDGQLQGSWYE